jgi:hypothetical protein
MAPFSWLPMGPRIVVWYLISLAATVGCRLWKPICSDD